MFSRQKSWDGQAQRQITEGEAAVCAVASGTVHEFEQTLADELGALEQVGALLEEKKGFIKGQHQDTSVSQVAGMMTAITENYRSLLPESRQRQQEVVDAGEGSRLEPAANR
jgi:phosphoserine phosphatase